MDVLLKNKNMAIFIDKDALVAEIERLRKKNNESENVYDFGTENALKSVLSFIDTLEVKEVDLEKFAEKINTFQARYKHPTITSIKGAMAFMARMFYQYPNVAREWYESLPKATMD